MKKRNVLLIVLLVVACVSLGVVGEDLLPHDPISIMSDDDLVAENGVISGDGTIDDPYLIAGWTIDARAGVGIRVQGTLAHVRIRDCHVMGDGRRSIGILLREAAQVPVVGCSFSALGSGIFVYQNPGASIEANDFTDCRRGVDGTESDGITVLENNVIGSQEHGIFLWRCHDGSLEGNVISDCRNGIYLDSCHRNALNGNRVESSDRGIFLWDCFDCTIVGNMLGTCGLGLALVHTSERNTVFRNVFVDNGRHATCDEVDNQWDGGYEAGGNYWAGETTADEFSGPEQSQPGTDGISDVAILVPFVGIDRYPLMAVPVEDG
ncbi:nitrous oxide reductase family maturation protein NosD [Candidatus Bipolaricaulota bacterium]